MHILVFEPARGGHHLVFLRYIVRDLLAGGHTVTLAVATEPAPSAELRETLGDSLDTCGWHRLAGGAGRLLHGRRLDQLAHAQASVGADVVFVNCLDLFTSALFRRSALGLPFPRTLRGKVSGIFVRPRVADRRLDSRAGASWKRRGFIRLMREGYFRRLFVLDETLPDSLVPGVRPEAIVPLPDPWEGDYTVGRAEARRALGLPPDSFLYLHYGTASPRKGLPTVLKATAALPANSNAALVCAGRAGEAHAGQLAALRSAGRAHVFNRFIAEAEEPLFFRSCDAIVLAYEGHYGSSAVQARAAAAGRMVIASDEGLIGRRTREQRLGLTFATGDEGALAAALVEAGGLGPEAFAPGLAAYARHHSRENFQRVLLEALDGK